MKYLAPNVSRSETHLEVRPSQIVRHQITYGRKQFINCMMTEDRFIVNCTQTDWSLL